MTCCIASGKIYQSSNVHNRPSAYMKPISPNGFTLIEIAVVLAIIGLLLGGILVPLSAQMEQHNISDTQKSLSDIKEAVIGYALANGRLPCPAKPALISGVDALAGQADCTITTGVIPWVTLGVNETDAWGHRFTYSVTPEFADAISANSFGYDSNPTYGCVSTHVCTPTNNPLNSSFALCSCGALNVRFATAGTIIASNVPAVIVSHGKNGAGAYTPKGQQLAVGSNTDELENSDADTTFVSHTPTATFDDLVVWVSPNILLNRMVAAGKLP